MLNFTIKHIHFSVSLCVVLVTITLPLVGQTITGTVFRDFNSNGLYEAISDPTSYTYGEPGVGGVTVTAYDPSGAAIATTVSSTVTTTVGNYTLAVGNSGAYRVEFTNLQSGDYEASRGGNSATSVQFVNGGATNVNLGVNYPAEYCQSVSPLLITTCFIAADPTAGAPSVTQRVALVGTPYTVEDDTKAMTYLATIGEVGSTWGVAYNKSTGQIYSSSFTKRHVGFSANGPNAIYVTSPTSATSGNTTEFFNFTTIGGTAVSSTTETHGNDLPTTTASLASHDSIGFDAVGKTSLGGIDLSDDDKTLYVVNLKNRTLYSIDVATKTATGVPIPNPGCTTSSTTTESSYRPFAVKFYRGKVYVGVVCTREDLGTTTVPYGPTDGLSATVYALDPAVPASFTTVLSFPLTYQKGASGADVLPDSPTNQARSEFWRPWTSIYQADRNEGVVSFPQAWLTDIEFEPTTGDMLIGLRDRFGDQTGYKNYKPGSNTDLISGIAPGEILRARKCSPTDILWTLENDGSLCSDITSTSVTQTTTAGPGTGKYYWGDRVQNGANHGLSSQGSMAQLGGSAKVAMTAIDPTEIFNTGGIKRLINATGAKDGNPTGIDPNPAAGVILYEEDAFGYGKANGLGDLELACQPAPIEIGNRVWYDKNDNGIQDPGEPPLAGVEVTLRGAGLSSPVSVTTNSAGEYYFSSAAGTPAPGFVYSLTGLTAGGSYSLAFPASFSTVMLSSRQNMATGPNADNIDSDPNSAGILAFVLGQAGQNNFSFDAAYATCALALTGMPSSCDGTTNRYMVSGTVSFSNVSTGTLTVTDGAVSTTITVPAGTTSVAYSLSGLTTGSGSHTITASYSSTDCSPASSTYTAPTTCALLDLEKRVDKSKADPAEILTYTLVLTNTGSLPTTNITVHDSATIGLTYVPNSVSAPAGTTFTQGMPISIWTIAALSPSESLSLTIQAKADSTGILYNTASIPGDTARICTSIPVHMCAGDDYAFILTAPAGHTSYQWYKDGQVIPNATTDTLEVTGPGSYSLAVDAGGGSGQCPNFSCCPFIVVEDSLPTFVATATPASCIGNVAQNNGQIVLSGFQAGLTYQYSLGATFNAAASLSGAPQVIPANGVIATTLVNPASDQVYTVRVYNASGCYTDVQVILLRTTCGCPADICVPYVLTQNKRPVRIGDPR
ncbi:SdrD B-like domain-containing protein [Spirosoma aerolatum]|uniref:SdrD B-like domain-containing protein n=1 Tax=Spirosoma aerolatum TaxID=1211326 RepID=UPI0009AF1C99|nr:SdrD B-like domain-containing protein [Spirosoma aerolatum]